MAKITNIKTRDGAVHPIALPFAVCSSTAGATIKTLTFSGGDAPTELVNGQQIMVQFTNGNTTACSISIPGLTSTPAMTLNNTSVTPYIGAGAVVNLTYNGTKFYVSNAAALTGFKVPADVTLATITNSGTITDIANFGKISSLINADNSDATIDSIDNYGKIKEIQNSGTLGTSVFSGGLTNNGQLYRITNQNAGTIYYIYNYNQVQDLDNTSIITKLTNNDIGHINRLANLGNIEDLKNGGNITITNQHTTGGHNNGVLYITNESYDGVYDDRYSGYVNITNKGELHATNSSTNDPVELSNSGKIDTINNSGKISSLINTGTITTFTNTTIGDPPIEGNIGTFNLDSGSINTFHADSGITNFYIESYGSVDTLTINVKPRGRRPAISTLNNNNRIVALNNNTNGTISTLTNTGIISTLTNTSNGRINKLSNLTAKIPVSPMKDYPAGTVISEGIWKIDPGFNLVYYGSVQVDNRDLGILGYNCHYAAQSGTEASTLLYKTAGSTSYAPLGASGDPYYISPQGTAGNNCLLVIWEGENVSIGHSDGDSTHITLTPGIYRIFYKYAVNKIYYYEIYKLTLGRL